MTNEGQVQQGVITAENRAAAVRLLLGRGETATTINPLDQGNRTQPSKSSSDRLAKEATSASLSRIKLPAFLQLSVRKGSVSRAEMATLIRELATVIEAGLPIMQGLRTVRRQCSSKSLEHVLDHLIARVEAGAPLYQAAAEYGAPFDDLIVGMLRAADASGEMTEVLHQLADLLDRSLELRREILGATMYPMILAGLIAVSVVILVTVLVPRLIEPMAGTMTMPLPTQILLSMAAFLGSYWLICIIGIAAICLSWKLWVDVPQNRIRYDTFKLRSPILGRLLRDVAVARFTRTLGTLVTSGIPILDALKVTRDTLGNKALQQEIDLVSESVAAGKSLAEPLEQSGLFPPLLIQVVNLGERSGRLESMLLHAAGAFDRQVNSSIKLFTKALPPVLIIIMAAIGGFVLSAVLLPLLELQAAF